MAALGAAITLLLIAAAVALVDAKVSDAAGGESAAVSDSVLDAFEGPITVRHEVPEEGPDRRLCLIRYTHRTFGDDSTPSGHWWTSCPVANALATVIDVKEQLALPARFGVRDVRVRAEIPVGTDVTYLEGKSASQCEHVEDRRPCKGHSYPGGANQYYFLDPRFRAEWITEVVCTRSREDRRPDWFACEG